MNRLDAKHINVVLIDSESGKSLDGNSVRVRLVFADDIKHNEEMCARKERTINVTGCFNDSNNANSGIYHKLGFKGECGQWLSLVQDGKAECLCGLGQNDQLKESVRINNGGKKLANNEKYSRYMEKMRQVGHTIFKMCKHMSEIEIIDSDEMNINAMCEILTGLYLYGHPCDIYKSKDKTNAHTLGKIYIKNKTVYDAFVAKKAILDAVLHARELSNMPANMCHPFFLEQEALKLGSVNRNASSGDKDLDSLRLSSDDAVVKTGDIQQAQCKDKQCKIGKGEVKVTVLREMDLHKLKMYALLGVGQGSQMPSRLIVIEYTHPDAKNTDHYEVGSNDCSVLNDDRKNCSDKYEVGKDNECGEKISDCLDEVKSISCEHDMLCKKYTGLNGEENESVMENVARSIGLVGKGITFDTGGISIKPSDNMHHMKHDMTGAAIVLSTMKCIYEMNLPVNVVGVMAVAENMCSGSAIRPGDILTCANGKTVEVLNTDAEGRLVLADALWYLQKHYNPSCIVDLATLTGAIGVALGPVYAGLFSNNDKMSKELIVAGRTVGEEVWRMPIGEKYSKAMRSDIADLQNISGKGFGGGSCTAAAFLNEFIDTDRAWCHIDIASVSYMHQDWFSSSHGATGFGVKLLMEWICNNIH